IIAVPGLTPRSGNVADHAWDTWRTPSGPSGRLWLRDDLPQHLPDARIFLYEYSATAVYEMGRGAFVREANDLLEAISRNREGVASRPLLFLGHDVGGLLIKQALINALNDPMYSPIKDATSGLAFFATPHRRSGVPLRDRNLAAEVETTLLETWHEGSIFSDDTVEAQRYGLLDYLIVSFWGTRDQIVPREDARLGMSAREDVVPLIADHETICKFGTSPTDQDNLFKVMHHIKFLYMASLHSW
ncbi:hypothetical protein BFJ67_g17092, partial [Fusarium oxysporum f. sp. cepae]